MAYKVPMRAMICMLCLREWLSDKAGEDTCPRCYRWAGTEGFGIIRLDKGPRMARVFYTFLPYERPRAFGTIQGVGVTSAHWHRN